MNCVQSSINQFLITWDLHTLPDYEEDDDDANMYFSVTYVKMYS